MSGRTVVVALAIGLTALAPVARAGEPELGVEDAVAATLAAQPKLRAAEAELRAADARVQQAAWKRLGTLETVGLYTPFQRPLQVEFPGIPNLVPPTSFEVKQLQTYALNATLAQPLWTWGALSGNRASARSDLAADSRSLERLRQQLVLEASEAFFVATTASAAVGVAEENLEQQRSFLQATQGRLRAGTAARLDVLKAELAVSEAESALLSARNRETLAREALVTLTMDSRFRSAALRAAGAQATDLPSEADAVARALATRPDLESLRLRGEALGLRVKAIRASSLPALGLRASWTQQHDDLGNVFSRRGQIYQLGLALSWDPTEALRNRSRAAEAQAMQDAVGQGLRGADAGVALEVRSALSSASEAQVQVGVARRALATAEEQARVARLAYREGAISALEARDAELGLTNARFAELRARLQLAVAQARLRFAIGE